MAEDAATVSVEAHNRVTKERDDLKARTAELEKVVKDVGLRDQARSHFEAQGISDPGKWAEVALPHLRDVELDALPGKLDGLFPDLPKAAPPPVTEDGEPEAPSAPPPPPPAVAGPDPSAPGQPPEMTRLKFSDPEYQDILKREGVQGHKRLVQEGRVQLSRDNQYADTP